MTPFFRHQHAKVSEIILCDIIWVTHNLLGEWFVLLMQNFVHRTVIEIWVSHSVNSHKILDNTVSHWESTLHFLIAKVKTCHFKSKLCLSCKGFCHVWAILLDYTSSIVFPIVGLKTVADIRSAAEICVLWKNICSMDLELIQLLLRLSIKAHGGFRSYRRLVVSTVLAIEFIFSEKV